MVCSTTIGTKLFMYCSKRSDIRVLLARAARPAPSSNGSTRQRNFTSGVGHCQQFLRGDLAFSNLRQLDDEVDHFVLEDRRSQSIDGAGVLAVKIEDVPFVTGMTARLAGDRLVHFVRGNGNVVLAPDFRKQQAEPDPSLRKPAVFGPCRLVVLARSGGGWDRVAVGDCWGRLGADFPNGWGRLGAGNRGRRFPLGLVLPPDVVELEIHHARRDGEVVTLRQLVEQRPL